MWIILSILITIFSKWDTFHVIKVQISKLFVHKIVIIFSHESLNLNESTHEISNNVVCATNKGSDQPTDIPIKLNYLNNFFASCTDSVSGLRVRIFKQQAKALTRLRVYAG